MRLLAAGLPAVAVCGEEELAPRAQATATPTATATPEAAPPLHSARPRCRPAGGVHRLCFGKGPYGEIRLVTGPLNVERPEGTGAGGWIWAAASPDGRSILMQWSGECEIPTAYLVPGGGGRPRPAVPGRVNSTALGWTTDGRAIVFVPAEPGCGSGEDAGLFLVEPGGARERIGPAAKRPPIRPSVRPRAATRLRDV